MNLILTVGQGLLEEEEPSGRMSDEQEDTPPQKEVVVTEGVKYEISVSGHLLGAQLRADMSSGQWLSSWI